MSISPPASNEVERIWLATRRRVGAGRGGADRRSPSAGVSAVLLALREHGPMHGGEVARRGGLDQGNTSRWLHMLRDLGFLAAETPIAEIKYMGGFQARVWALTKRGRELAKALAAQDTTRQNGVMS